MTSDWLIEFQFDEDEAENEMLTVDDGEDPLICYAGWAGDSLGFAPTLKSAARFPTREIAERHLANYGSETAACGSVFEMRAE